MKKFIFIIFALILPLMASAWDEEFYYPKIDGVYYSFNTSDLTASVSCRAHFIEYFSSYMPGKVEFEYMYSDYSGDVLIPQEVTYNDITYKVTSIGKRAFWEGRIHTLSGAYGSGCSGMTSVTIPNSVTSFGENAFDGCSGLTSIIIPGNVKSIAYGAFCNCSGLVYITLPQNLESIGQNAFNGCDGLTDIYCYSVTVPSAYEKSFPNPENIILHIPEESIEAYRSTEPWDKFKDYVPLTKSDIEATEKCSKPTITLVDGTITFNCETPEVTYHWNISNPNGTSGSSSTIQPITLNVYATKSGYQNSDVTTYKFPGINGDVDCNGVVNVADHVKLSEIIMNQ